jgi:hypothetical protein
MPRLPSASSTHQFLRCKTRQASSDSDQQLRLACADHRQALSLPLVGRTILQMDQTTSSDQEVLRHHRERSQNTNLDCHHRLRLGRYREKTPQYRGFALHNPTNIEPHSFRESTTRSIA